MKRGPGYSVHSVRRSPHIFASADLCFSFPFSFLVVYACQVFSVMSLARFVSFRCLIPVTEFVATSVYAVVIVKVLLSLPGIVVIEYNGAGTMRAVQHTLDYSWIEVDAVCCYMSTFCDGTATR